MKITYKQQISILNYIERHTSNDLSGLKGDLALEVFEVEQTIEDAFRPHNKRAKQMYKRLVKLERKEKEGDNLSKNEKKEMMEISKEFAELDEKEKELDLPTFPFGDGSDRDMKPHLSYPGIKAFKPLLNLTPKKATTDEEHDSE